MAYVKDLMRDPSGSLLTRTEKFVLFVLADSHNDDQHIAWPSLDRLAEQCLISKRGLITTLQQLATRGLLTIVKHATEQGWSLRNEYQFPQLARGEVAAPHPQDVGSEVGAQLGVKFGAARGEVARLDDSSLILRDKQEKKEEKKEEKTKKEKSAPQGALVVSWRVGFLQIWGRYPRKIGKGAAEKAYQKIHPGQELLETILQKIAAAERTAQWQKDGGEFIPHLATWLNQRRWEDDYPEPAPAAARSVLEYAGMGNKR